MSGRLVAAEARRDVLHPVATLGELAFVDEVDARGTLRVAHLGHRGGKAFIPDVEPRPDVMRSRQGADVGGEDPVRAASHDVPRFVDGGAARYDIRHRLRTWSDYPRVPVRTSATTHLEEPARATPVYGTCDVLVVGGGPAGTAAAVAAGRLGADVVLLERYNHLGGLSTGGLVSWIDRMSDWDGRLVVAGIGAELIDRCGPDATLGPDPELWGSTDPVQAAYWRVRTTALRDMVHWSPTLDPEVLKLVTHDLVRESNVHTLMHCWVVAAITTGSRIEGVIFESKQGRFAVTAPVVIDCTGDGDVFAQAGAAFDDDFDSESAHARLTTSFRFGNVDMRRYLDFRMLRQDEFADVMKRAAEEGIKLLAHPTPYDSVTCVPHPEDVRVLGARCRRPHRRRVRLGDVRWARFFRDNVPGFERAWILDTASQVGTRHPRRLADRYPGGTASIRIIPAQLARRHRVASTAATGTTFGSAFAVGTAADR